MITPEEMNELCIAASDAYQSATMSARWPAVIAAVLETRARQETANVTRDAILAGDYPDAKAPPADGRTGKV